MVKYKVWIDSYKMLVDVQRINFDVETIEVQIGEGDLYEFRFDEVELLEVVDVK